MLRANFLLCLFGSLSLIGCAQHHRVADAGTLTQAPPALAGDADVLRNVSYASVLALPHQDHSIKLAYGPEPLQFGRLYLPTHSEAPAPLLVFIHGGCWSNAFDISHSHAFSEALTANGFAVWSLEYRRTGDEGGGWPGTFEDVLAGLSFAEHGLADHPLDTSRLVVAGHSAGGHLALLAGSHHAQNPAGLHAVVGLAAIADLSSYAAGENACQRASREFIGGALAGHAERYEQANPKRQRMHPNTLLLQGTADHIVPADQAIDSGMPYSLLDDAGHFDWIHPHTPAFEQFVSTLHELLRRR
jgi:acetyl esterase/lipase